MGQLKLFKRVHLVKFKVSEGRKYQNAKEIDLIPVVNIVYFGMFKDQYKQWLYFGNTFVLKEVKQQ